MKKGFTLIEMLAVIALLGIIGAISFPIVTREVNKSKEKTYQTQINYIEGAAKRWGVKNNDLLTTDGTSITVNIQTLKKDGFLENTNIIDPRTNRIIDGCVEISYNLEYNQHSYNYIASCKEPTY